MLQLLKKEVFEPLQEASLLRPTQKTVFLVTLATAARVSEIHALSASAECLRFIDNGSVSLLTSPGFIAKNRLPELGSQAYSLSPLQRTSHFAL